MRRAIRSIGWAAILLVLAAFAALLASRIDWASRDQRIAANALIMRPGTYRSPDGTRVVSILEAAEERLKYTVVGPKSQSVAVNDPFQADSQWFMCWDAKGQLWSYVPELGVHRVYSEDGRVGLCEVGPAGGYDGMPRPFYVRLPKTVRAQFSEDDQPPTS